jgi:hypothetical protein
MENSIEASYKKDHAPRHDAPAARLKDHGHLKGPIMVYTARNLTL